MDPQQFFLFEDAGYPFLDDLRLSSIGWTSRLFRSWRILKHAIRAGILDFFPLLIALFPFLIILTLH